jgi:subfamily B ATP-binding cassette protein MsbA
MAYIWDATAGLRVIRGFGREAHESQRFGERSERVRTTFVRMQVLAGVVGPITQVATVAMIGSILAVAALRGDDMATLAGFLAIAYRMQPRVSAMLQARTQLRGMEAPVDEIAACLKVPPSDVPSATEAYTGLQRGLVLQNISARYPQAQQPALIDITCTIPFGSVTAVAGYSGAGKSTLVALLLRFIKPESGQILVDGVEIERIRPADWHRRIAFVERVLEALLVAEGDAVAEGQHVATVRA